MKLRHFALSALTLVNAQLLAACAPGSLPELTSGFQVRPSCPQSSDPEYFFPSGAIAPSNPESDRNVRQALSMRLSRIAAPSLSCQPSEYARYRLIWSGWPISTIVMVIAGEKETLVQWTEFQAPEADPPRSPELTASGTRTLDVGAAATLITLLDRAGFWTTPVPYVEGGEGMFVVFEAEEGGRYRTISRSGGLEGPFAEVAREFVHLADRPMPPNLLR